jgi:hypothetical protein
MRKLAIAITFAIAASVAPAAGATQILPDKGVSNVKLQVNKQGYALLQYQTSARKAKNVLLWGAVNATANTDQGQPQQKFKVDSTGGWGAFRKANYWRTFKNVCKAYDGPALGLVVTACKAPDGSYWAVQAWDRNLPMRGFDPWKPEQTALEYHVSHWSGPLPGLEVYPNWTYDATLQGFFGRLTYDGKAVYGTRSPSPTVSDPFSRNFYIDTFNSIYGSGWKHDTAVNTHKGNGGFCYSFIVQSPPGGYPGTKGGYPSDEPRGPGLGDRHRVTVMGPGVTPIVRWEGDRLGNYDPAKDAQMNQTFDGMLAGDQKCAAER